MAAFDELFLLRAFICIVESGSISAGARRLKIPQPTLSRYLRRLENHSGTALIRRDTHQMSLTETGHRLLSDARTMLAMADEAEHRLHEDQSMLRGHLRLFSTIDLGQFMVTRLISSFLQVNPDVTAELGYNNRPLHMIQEGCDAGIIVGDIADDSVVARPAGIVSRCLVAAPSLVKTRPPVKEPSDLKSWPWLIISSPQFDGTNKFTLYSSDRSEYSLQVSPVFITEGASSLREAARAGLGVVAISYWLIREDILSGRLIRVLPQWSAKALSCHIVYPAQRMLPARVRAFIDFATKYMTTELRSSKVS